MLFLMPNQQHQSNEGTKLRHVSTQHSPLTDRTYNDVLTDSVALDTELQ